jgi:alkaline phosphatase D
MDEAHVVSRLQDTKNSKGYSELKRVIGVWDDHDYGFNDIGSDFIHKVRNRKLFLDFIGEPKDTDRYLATDTPIYQDYYVSKGEKLVHIILLDNRFDYDMKTNDKLGTEQWLWLDAVLQEGKQHPVTMTVIGAGLQIIVDRQRVPIESFEWKNKKALFDLLYKHELG